MCDKCDKVEFYLELENEDLKIFFYTEDDKEKLTKYFNSKGIIGSWKEIEIEAQEILEEKFPNEFDKVRSGDYSSVRVSFDIEKEILEKK